MQFVRRAVTAVWLASLFSLGLAACGTPASIRLGEQSARVIAVEDVRPEASTATYERIDEAGQEVRHYGDDAFSPNPAVLVGAMLSERFGERLEGRRVRLVDFTVEVIDRGVSFNAQVQPAQVPGASAGQAALGNALGYGLIHLVEGWRQKNKTLFANIELDMDGKLVAAQRARKSSGHIGNDEFRELMRETLEELATSVAEAL